MHCFLNVVIHLRGDCQVQVQVELNAKG